MSARTPSPMSARTPSPNIHPSMQRRDSNAQASSSRSPTQPLALSSRPRAPSSPEQPPRSARRISPDHFARAQQAPPSAPIPVPNSAPIRRPRPKSASSDFKLPYALSSEEEDSAESKKSISPTQSPTRALNIVKPLWSPPKSSQGFDSLARHFQPTTPSSTDSHTPSTMGMGNSGNRTTMTSMSSYSRDSEKSDDENRIPQRSNTFASRPASGVTRPNGPKRSLTTPAPKPPAVTFSVPTSPKSAREPAEAKSNESQAVQPKKSHRPRDCVNCRTVITDGRWVPMETNDQGGGKGGVLCENCWKEMYLPKVCYSCDICCNANFFGFTVSAM